MSFSQFINAQLTQKTRPTYAWQEWECEDYFMWDEPDGYLSGLSDAAAMALVLGSAQWIWERLGPLQEDRVPFEVIEAGWAFIFSPQACFYYEPDADPWQGPVRSPLQFMMVVVMDALYARDQHDELRARVFWMANLARYVLDGDAGAFDRWFEAAVARLEAQHPAREMAEKSIFDFDLSFNPKVGPSALLIERDYDPTGAERELRRLVEKRGATNPLIDIDALEAENA